MPKNERLKVSQHATNLFRGEYSLEQDPAIQQRLSSMSHGILQDTQKEKCLTKVQDHLPTSSTNENLIKLSLVGTNVFQSEKAHALRLI